MTTTMLESTQHAARCLQVVRIEGDQAFASVRARWDEIYAADEQAHIFVSWSWLRAWFDVTPYGWFVLAVREEHDGPFVAFLPLAETAVRWAGATLRRELHLGGKPLADYAGLVCMPGYEQGAVSELTRYIAEQLRWDRFEIGETPDERLSQMATGLANDGIRVEPGAVTPCPYVRLPDAWDSFLAECMSRKGRFNLRRAMKQVEALDGFRLTTESHGTLEHDIEVLLRLWESRWGEVRPETRENYRHVYKRACADDSLWFRAIWEGQKPIAALGGFADRPKNYVCYFTSGFDEAYASLSPGKLIVAYSIRDAIAQGFEVFDFLLGAEPYKYAFGARDRQAPRAVAVRTSLRSTAGSAVLQTGAVLQRWRRTVRRAFTSSVRRLGPAN